MNKSKLLAVFAIISALMTCSVLAEEAKIVADLGNLRTATMSPVNSQQNVKTEETSNTALQDSVTESVDCFYLANANHPLCVEK